MIIPFFDIRRKPKETLQPPLPPTWQTTRDCGVSANFYFLCVQVLDQATPQASECVGKFRSSLTQSAAGITPTGRTFEDIWC